MPATTGGYTPTRDNLFYIGAAKQSVWGTPVAPTWFWLWLDGTSANPKPSHKKERQGDTSPYIDLVWKSGQYWEIKIVEYVRPQMAGYALQALLASGSDTYTAPAQSGTLSAAIVAGATSFSTALNLGSTGTLAMNFTPGYGVQAYEVQTVDLTTKTGTGPFTYTLAASAKFRNAHAINDTITSKAQHVFARQPGYYDAYSLDLAFGSSVFGISKAFRVQDAACYQLKISHDMGAPLKFEHDWFGAISSIDAALATPSYEGQNVIGATSAPFMWSQAQGSWNLDGATTLNALTIKKMELTLKNSTSAMDFQTEGLTPQYFSPGNLDIDGSLELIFDSYAQYLNTYFGSPTATTGAQDSVLTGIGSLATTYTEDAVNSLGFSLPSLAYTGAPLTPKLDAKDLTQQLAISGYNPYAGAPAPFSATLANSYASQY